MSRNKKQIVSKLCLVIALFLAGSIGGLCLYFGHPAEYHWLPACPFRVWTGFLCPGCGTLRATHHLLNGQIDVAFRCQPLLLSLLPILALLAGKMLYEHWRNKSLTLPFETQIYWLIVIAICLFFILRNIPLDHFECLRPPQYAVADKASLPRTCAPAQTLASVSLPHTARISKRFEYNGTMCTIGSRDFNRAAHTVRPCEHF